MVILRIIKMEMNLSKKDIISKLEKIGCFEGIDYPKVSIIVPAYNSEKYIAKCLFSLLKQTLKDIEIIVVDDASSDGTKDILDIFVKYDKRIKVIFHSENKKQGAARNSALKIAKGEYIGYVDSDDWVDLDYFEKLYNAAKKYDCDIALATNVRIGNGKTKYRLNIKKETFVKSLQDKIDLSNQAKNPCPTNKIYRRQMLEKNNIVWPEDVYCEDKLYTIQALYYSDAMVSVPDINYYYFRNPDSTVNNKKKTHLKKTKIDKQRACQEVLKFLKENNADIKDKQFWAVKGHFPCSCFPLIIKKESLKTAKYYLFGFIKIMEKKI